jgi:hypothetical protein
MVAGPLPLRLNLLNPAKPANPENTFACFTALNQGSEKEHPPGLSGDRWQYP